VHDLTVRFPTDAGDVRAVTGLSFTVRPGETLGVVGESGSGKTAAATALLGLHDPQRARVTGSVRVVGTEVVGAREPVLRRLRGRSVAMVFQDPTTALHPFYPVGRQVAEAYRAHHTVTRADAAERAVAMLDRVGIPAARIRAGDHPHQLSGGMRQRVVIAMALVNDPAVIVADEPTTALDVTVQADVLDLLREVQEETGTALVHVTHDLGVVAETADRLLVMYAGRAVETGQARELLTRPRMPYTWGLLRSTPDLGAPGERLRPIPGSPPSLLSPPSGCPFHPRCAFAESVPGNRCRTDLPDLLPVGDDTERLRRCHLPEAVRLDEGQVGR
jgi:peptide/nickel transport system ATP-binding protein